MNDEASKSILVVDDEANIRLMFRTVLSTAGYVVEEAPNGEVAQGMIRNGRFDMAIVDLNMPTLDGMGLLKALQDAPPEYPPRVVVLTAYGSIRTAVKATRLGAVDFQEKPVTPSDLRKMVATVLDSAEQPMELRSTDHTIGYEAVLYKVRKALRMVDTSTAEALLMRAADLAHNDAGYFNLLGVLYESRRQWRLAKKFYGSAIKLDKRYEPAQQNMRRLYELERFGKSDEPISLGDENSELWFAKMPSNKE